MNTLQASIVTPLGEVYKDDEATLVSLETTNGSIGVMANHVPLVATLKVGVLKIIDKNKKENYFAVSEGFVETHKDVVTIMVQTAEHSTNIDVDRAIRAKQRAKERLSQNDSNIDVLRAKMALTRALSRLRAVNK